MSSEPLSFYTIDHGTASTSAALLSPIDGRYRLLAAACAPSGVDPEAMLEDLAWRTARSDPELMPAPDRWPALPRLVAGTRPPPGVCLVAASARTGRALAQAFGESGWAVRARFDGPVPDVLALGEACLDPAVQAVVMAVTEDADADERERLPILWALVVSLASFRDDLAVIASGPVPERPDTIPDHRLFALPAPEPVAVGTESALRQAARQVGWSQAVPSGRAHPARDARQGIRSSVASLATLLDRRVAGFDVGASCGSQTIAHPDREVRHVVTDSGALLPPHIVRDDEQLDEILRWTAVRGEPGALHDRLRDMSLWPWRGVDAEAARLRLGAIRGALRRLGSASSGSSAGDALDDTADVLVVSGGCFAAVPPPGVSLAVIDSVRRPGATMMLLDHARILGPLGILPDEGDRRRLLADLMDDCLLPLGSALLTGEFHVGARPLMLEVGSPLGKRSMELEAGMLRLVDLPPGIVGRVVIDAADGTILGVRDRRLALEVSGGLGGLLVDTREIPLSMPEASDQRHALLDAWEQRIWAGAAA